MTLVCSKYNIVIYYPSRSVEIHKRDDNSYPLRGFIDRLYVGIPYNSEYKRELSHIGRLHMVSDWRFPYL